MIADIVIYHQHLAARLKDARQFKNDLRHLKEIILH